MTTSSCPVCGSVAPRPVLRLDNLPALPNAPHPSPESAVSTPRGDIDLVVCTGCGHLYNAAFDPDALAYSEAYDNSLHFSGTFRDYATELVERLVEDHPLAGSLIVEIGSGSGDFLAMLCERAGATGMGFDPSHEPGRADVERSDRVTLSAKFYPTDGSLRPDFVLSQHVLEHLEQPAALLAEIRSTYADNAVAYHEVPDGEFMLRHTALWDLIYEHISYFTTTSLARLAHESGHTITAHGTAFGEQYAWVELAASAEPGAPPAPADVALSVAEAIDFGHAAEKAIGERLDELARFEMAGPVAVWGAGSKGISYLNLIAGPDRVDAVVDISPRKEGTFIAGTGHRVVNPDALAEISPRTVVLANPIYRDEVTRVLERLCPGAQVAALW